MTTNRSRRRFLGALGLFGAAGASAGLLPWHWPDGGFINPCLQEPLPDELTKHDLWHAAWQDIDPAQMWDCHVHAVGTGDSGSGIWVTPQMQSAWAPIKYLQYRFYLNASCVPPEGEVDVHVMKQLLRLLDAFPPGAKVMLLAFDHHYTSDGAKSLERSTFHVPNEYVRNLARDFPARFEWIASVHPYRKDCVDVLRWAAENGARAVKWLPPAMGMDPGSPKCDNFYAAMVKHRLPLLTHAGDEHAVEGAEFQALGNPLLLRRALDHGVRVIVAHCATQGDNIDLDNGANGPRVANFELFSRLMDEPRYEGSLFGEISATTQINRIKQGLARIIERQDWHSRLLNGSDYPLPGVMPLFNMTSLVAAGLLDKANADYCRRLRPHNTLMADFVVKRLLRVGNARFAPGVFMTRDFFLALPDAE